MDFFGTIQSQQEYYASELCYQAYDTDDISIKIELVKQALEIYPRSVEAYSLLGYCYCDGPEGIRNLALSLQYINKAVQIDSYRELRANDGILEWGYQENRPYLRAIFQKARTLSKLERIQEEIEEYKKLLKLCPSDNLGARKYLISRLIEINDLETADTLIKVYAKDTTDSIILYSRALVNYYKFREGLLNIEELEESIILAYEENQTIPSLLLDNSIACYSEEFPKESISASNHLDNAHIYVGPFRGKLLWEKIHDALDFLREYYYVSSLRKEKPTEKELINILSNRQITIHFKNNSKKLCSKSGYYMIGRGLDTFQYPPNWNADSYENHKDNSQIIVFETTDDWVDNGFISFYYEDIITVPFWSLFLKSIDFENRIVTCPLHFCESCYDPQPYQRNKSKRYNYSSKKEKIKICLKCRDKRFENNICELCFTRGDDMYTCSKCKSVVYCSKECQSSDWKQKHKKNCKEKKQIDEKKTNIVLNVSKLVFVLTDLLTKDCLEYLVGIDYPVVIRNVKEIVSLSRTCSTIRNSLLNIKLFKYLVFEVNLSICSEGFKFSNGDDDDEEEEGEGEKNDGGSDWGWKPLLKYPSDIINTYILYGGRYITGISIQLRKVDDKSLDIIATNCKLLTRVELTCSSYNNCQFATKNGLLKFFKNVSNLSFLSLRNHQGEENIDKFFPMAVLKEVAKRSFPLEGLFLGVTIHTIDAIRDILESTMRVTSCYNNDNNNNNNNNKSKDNNKKNNKLKDNINDKSKSVTSSSCRVLSLDLVQDYEISEDILCGIELFSSMVRSNPGLFSNINSLKINNLEKLKNNHLSIISKNMPNIKELDIGYFSGNNLLTDEGLYELAKYCKLLRAFDISGRSSISMKGIIRVCENNPSLQKLAIDSTEACNASNFIANFEKIMKCATNIIIFNFWVKDLNSFGLTDLEKRKIAYLFLPLMLKYPQTFFIGCTMGLINFPDDYKVSKEIEDIRRDAKDFIGRRDKEWIVCSFADDTWTL